MSLELGSCCCSRNKGHPIQKNPVLWFLGATSTWTWEANEKELFPAGMAQDLCLLAVSSPGGDNCAWFQPETEISRWSELRCSPGQQRKSRAGRRLLQRAVSGVGGIHMKAGGSQGPGAVWEKFTEDSWLVFPARCEGLLWVHCSVRTEQQQLSHWLEYCWLSELFSFAAVILLFPPCGFVTALLSSSSSVWEPFSCQGSGRDVLSTASAGLALWLSFLKSTMWNLLRSYKKLWTVERSVPLSSRALELDWLPGSSCASHGFSSRLLPLFSSSALSLALQAAHSPQFLCCSFLALLPFWHENPASVQDLTAALWSCQEVCVLVSWLKWRHWLVTIPLWAVIMP